MAQAEVNDVKSVSQTSETSQTAQDYIASQLSLEADAREALPYQFDTCTKPLGPLRQSVYACLTCTPPPASKYQQFSPAGVCYSCSISCHGEHTLVELFTKRDFVCDCGTTRMSNSGTPCSLRLDPETSRKGGVVGEEARVGNKYNQNFEGKFCGCGDEYDPEHEKGTMFQCIGLGPVDEGGCGEDWWHPECLLELPRIPHRAIPAANGHLNPVKEESEEATGQTATNSDHQHDGEDPPLPPGFPHEDDFDSLICYKCVNAFPWIKQYANTHGFLTAKTPAQQTNGHAHAANGALSTSNGDSANVAADVPSSDAAPETKKRKAEEDPQESQDSKRTRSDKVGEASTTAQQAPRHTTLPPAPPENTTLFLTDAFRENLCRCPTCFPLLAKHPPLLEEEEAYEPPLSESSDGAVDDGRRSVNSGSILERGEAALNNMDRVRAIEGVMAYNHVRDKVKDFLKPFAESGQAVSAEEVKAYFARLRGDEAAGREALADARDGGGGDEKDFRREQGGY